MHRILNSLQRITYSTKFIPEIDGLRFIAIISVILFHINVFMADRNHNTYLYGSQGKNIISNILSRGHLGVELFFVISGFILSYPFAAHYINKTPIPDIRQYFIRRLTRIEPPYVISMLVLFIALIVMHSYTVNELTPSLFASLLYVHNIFYPGLLPYVNSVAWSLEIEIQFYIIAPVLAQVFAFSTYQRRLLIISTILIFSMIQDVIKSPIPNIANYIQYFGIGFLLSDLRLTNTRLRFVSNNALSIFTGIASFCFIWMLDPRGVENGSIFIKIGYQIFLIASIFVFYYLVLFNNFWKRLFSTKIITVIGGMCYSIYLLHNAIIIMIGNLLVRKLNISDSYPVEFAIHTAILMISILVISTLYFKFIEQPCMKKDWHLHLLKNMKLYFNSR